MPSIVSTADGFHSSSPVVERERERVEDQRLRVHPVLVADELVDALRDLELALARSWPCRPSSIVSAISAAPCSMRERDDAVELVAARPRG